MELTHSDVRHLEIIYDAYDRIYDIASHRWDASGYYHVPSQTSGLMGHYVRRLDAFNGRDPSLITWQEYVEHSKPLLEAMDAILHLILGAGDYLNIRDILSGYTPGFKHLTPHARAMAAFRLIEARYPRSRYRVSETPVPKRRRHSPAQSYVNRRPSARGTGPRGGPGSSAGGRSHSPSISSTRKSRPTWLPYKD